MQRKHGVGDHRAVRLYRTGVHSVINGHISIVPEEILHRCRREVEDFYISLKPAKHKP